MLHNLLPPIEKKALRIEYYVRLGTVIVFLITSAVGIGAVSLLPTYLKLRSEIDAITLDSGSPQAETASTTVMGDQAIISDTKRTLMLFEATLGKQQVTDIIRAAFAVRPDTVTISGVTYDQATRSVTLEGVATTRDALVGFAHTLEDTSTFGRVPLSISDLAKNTNIQFRLNLAIENDGAPKP
jgi:hypothetical protein